MFAGVSDEEIKAQCGDAEMMGYAENKEVLDSTAPSVYFDMCDIWESLGETVNRKAANDSLTIERKNNNAGYSPENCEWISRSDQARNRSTSFLVEHNSEKVSCADLSRMYGLEKHTILNRLRKGIPLEEAISQQSRTGRLYSICGETGTIQQIAERHGLNRSTLLGRIRRGVPDSELFAPPKKTHLATK